MLVSQYHKTVNSTVDHWDGKAKEARPSVHVIETEMIRMLFFFSGFKWTVHNIEVPVSRSSSTVPDNFIPRATRPS